MRQKSIQSAFILLCIVCLTVIGCGKKTGLPMLAPEPPSEPPPLDSKPPSLAIEDPTTVLPTGYEPLGAVGAEGILGNRPEVAAQAVPSHGSVFQSSETAGGVTQGTLTVTHQDAPQDYKEESGQVEKYVPFYKFTYDDGHGGKSVLDETAWVMQDPRKPDGPIGIFSGWSGFFIEHCPWSDCINKPANMRHSVAFETSEGSRTFVDKWTNFTLHENREDGSSTFVEYFSDFQKSSENDPDTDYMVFGYWMHVPEDAEYQNDVIVGVFADGGDPFAGERLNSLEGTATYVGDAGGVYRETRVGGASDGHLLRSAHFSGKATLNANFGFGNAGNGSIEGQITDLDFNYTGPDEDLSFVLTETSLSDFMTGDTKAESSDTDWVGRWGAQFYGNGPCAGDSDCYPSSIAGTFGATSTISETQDEERTRTILGGFGAYLQPPQ